MQRVLSIPLGVVIGRDKIDSPWQEFAWRAVGVFLHAPEAGAWRELNRGPTFVHYHAATLPVELHPKETMGYQANLATGTPSVYVIMREKLQGGPEPIEVALVTASPHEAEAYGHTSEEIVGAVPMPQPLAELLEAYVAEHHVEEPFIKRQRQRHHRDEEHKFGQEPVSRLHGRTQPIQTKRDGDAK